ncbi:MAG: esterase-like activity of phytase family protein [Alphaproteobacteria bacterium]|nr:esterase-like activity of phytase family protein [Alphaproteobacteria bacterium]
MRLLILGTALATLCGSAAMAQTAAIGEPIAVSAESLLFHPADPEVKGVGRIAFKGGLALKSDEPEFGGISGITVAPDGETFTAITDQGRWISGTLTYGADGRLSGIAGVRIARMLTDADRGDSKVDQDAESLTSLKTEEERGSLLVGFEQRHRIGLYRFAAEGMAAKPRIMDVPAPLGDAPLNNGLEALCALPDGRIIAVTEELLDKAGNTLGAILPPPGARGAAATFSLTRDGDYSPTDLALLPEGDLMLLERRFSPATGVGMRLRRIATKDLEGSGPARGEVVAELNMTFAIDNMEGLSARADEEGRTLLYVVSDDNFNAPIQRTILLMFELTAAPE